MIFDPIGARCNEIPLSADRGNTRNLLGHCELLGHEHLRARPNDPREPSPGSNPLGDSCGRAAGLRPRCRPDARAGCGGQQRPDERASAGHLRAFRGAPVRAEECRECLKPDETLGMRLLGRTVPAIRTPDGIRAMEKDFRPASSASVGRYLASKFGDHLDGICCIGDEERAAGWVRPLRWQGSCRP
jgi:hypothetical protein